MGKRIQFTCLPQLLEWAKMVGRGDTFPHLPLIIAATCSLSVGLFDSTIVEGDITLSSQFRCPKFKSQYELITCTVLFVMMMILKHSLTENERIKVLNRKYTTSWLFTWKKAHFSGAVKRGYRPNHSTRLARGNLSLLSCIPFSSSYPPLNFEPQIRPHGFYLKIVLTV